LANKTWKGIKGWPAHVMEGSGTCKNFPSTARRSSSHSGVRGGSDSDGHDVLPSARRPGPQQMSG
jgi:hypothetical protein